jgi:hypothetical protein
MGIYSHKFHFLFEWPGFDAVCIRFFDDILSLKSAGATVSGAHGSFS